MSTSILFRRAALGAFVAAAASACAPTVPTRATESTSAPAPAAAAARAPAPTPAAAPPAAWPAASQALTADDLRRRISGKAFDVRLDQGTSARLDYRDGGYVFVNVYPSGASDTGRWRVDGSRVCTEMRRFPSDCNEWRTVGDKLMLRRTNGQLLTLEAR